MYIRVSLALHARQALCVPGPAAPHRPLVQAQVSTLSLGRIIVRFAPLATGAQLHLRSLLLVAQDTIRRMVLLFACYARQGTTAPPVQLRQRHRSPLALSEGTARRRPCRVRMLLALRAREVLWGSQRRKLQPVRLAPRATTVSLVALATIQFFAPLATGAGLGQERRLLVQAVLISPTMAQRLFHHVSPAHRASSACLLPWMHLSHAHVGPTVQRRVQLEHLVQQVPTVAIASDSSWLQSALPAPLATGAL